MQMNLAQLNKHFLSIVLTTAEAGDQLWLGLPMLLLNTLPSTWPYPNKGILLL